MSFLSVKPKVIFSIYFVVLWSILITVPNSETGMTRELIYIRVDGSVEGTDRLQQDGNVYSFSREILGFIIVEKEGVIIDGVGFLLENPDFNSVQSPEGHGIVVDGKNDVTIRNVIIKNFMYGIYINNSVNVHINDNKIVDNSKGIVIDHSTDTSLRGNQVINSTDVGIDVVESLDTVLNNNIINCNANTGINFSFITTVTDGLRLTDIMNCAITGNEIGLILNSFNELIKPVIYNCNITDNTVGISVEASFVIIRYNNIANNSIGIQLAGSNNSITHNNFIKNTKQVYDIAKETPDVFPSINTWNSDNRGNYWSEYNNIDNDGNGIVDMPYIIDENNQDSFPVTEPYKIPYEDPVLPDELPKPIIFYGIILIISIIVATLLFIFVRKKKKSGSSREYSG